MDHGVRSEGIALKNLPHIIKTWNDDEPSQCFGAQKLIEEDISKYKAQKEMQRKSRKRTKHRKKSTESLVTKDSSRDSTITIEEEIGEPYNCEMQGQQIKKNWLCTIMNWWA